MFSKKGNVKPAEICKERLNRQFARFNKLISPRVYDDMSFLFNNPSQMAVSRQKKEQMLADLVEKFKTSKSVMFSQNRGLSVTDGQALRAKLRENGVELKVAKKTLIKLAAKEAGIQEIPSEALEGPIAAAFAFEDEIAAAKILFTESKTNEAIALVGGIFDGEAFGPEKALQLAQIPGKEELLAKLVGSMKAPISGFYGVLHGTMRQFVGTLQAIVDQGGVGEAPAATETAEAPAAEEAPTEAPAEEAAAPTEEAPAAEESAEATEAPAAEATESEESDS